MLDPLYTLFGAILSWLYYVIGNYGLVIIFFSLAINSLLVPLRLKSQRNMIKQQFLQPALNDIKRHFANDPQRQQQESAALMKRTGVSMGAGCLSSIIPLIIIWPIWRIIRAPLQYVGQVSVENITKIAEFLVDKGLLGDNILATVAQNDLPIINILKNNASALTESVSQGWIRPDQLINTNFLGMDLGRVPSFNPLEWFGPNWRVELPLIILPILTVVTMMLNMKMSRLNVLRKPPTKEEVERAKSNPAKAGQAQADPSEKTMKYMQYFMPVLMIFTVFTMPSAMGLYWVTSNLVFIAQSWISYEMYIKPARAILAEEEGSVLLPQTAMGSDQTADLSQKGTAQSQKAAKKAGGKKKKKRGKG
ncbi:MAG TPA: YidC/Oxa1 family membrane protein insertase [Clostridiaceae bacterium]|nr:YidC/Oxa1 family membrane protein insertase [Clostridiaceae bacterium]